MNETGTDLATISEEPAGLDEINATITHRRTVPAVRVHGDNFQPTTVEALMRLCDYLAKHGGDAVPKVYQGKPGAMFIAISAGAPLGLSWTASLQGIAVINGIPSLWGKTAFATVSRHQDYDGIEEYEEGDPYDDKRDYVYHVTLKRRGRDPIHRSFSKFEAKHITVQHGQGQRGPLWDKPGPWADGFKKRMCRWRAFGYAAADQFADAMLGFGIVEEMVDVTPGHDRVAVDPGKSRTALLRETITQQPQAQSLPSTHEAAEFIVPNARPAETVPVAAAVAEKSEVAVAVEPAQAQVEGGGFDALRETHDGEVAGSQSPGGTPITSETVERLRGNSDFTTAKTVCFTAEAAGLTEEELVEIIFAHTEQYVLKKGASVTAIMNDLRKRERKSA